MKFTVEGMTCGHCVRAITRAVQALDPAARVAVDLETKSVVVEADLPATRIAAAIAAEGYTVNAA
ncbi:MAG: heavy-metal-associated domain-containing protein [Xanthomonadales bacterium]|nr:heavy-metal-associated domain-containing protein [Xanthomonadales bacterium]